MENLTANDFKDSVAEGIVLVDIWATWCGPCRMLGPIVERVAQTFADDDGVNVYKLNADDEAPIASEYGVTSVPTLLFFKNGELVKQVTGVQTEAVITQALNDLKDITV